MHSSLNYVNVGTPAFLKNRKIENRKIFLIRKNKDSKFPLAWIFSTIRASGNFIFQKSRNANVSKSRERAHIHISF
jgi:hypothetical protein